MPEIPTILVAEDRTDDVELLERMFKKAKVLNPLQVVDSVESAIWYFKGEGVYKDRKNYPFPILVLLDLHLNDGSGFEVLEWLQAHPTKSPLAVVVLTGSDVRAVRRSYALGAHSFLVKPLKFEDFENMISHMRGIKLTGSKTGRLVQTDPQSLLK